MPSQEYGLDLTQHRFVFGLTARVNPTAQAMHGEAEGVGNMQCGTSWFFALLEPMLRQKYLAAGSLKY
jgi:hypothetical protein